MTACGHQRVCGEPCLQRRRNRLARRRRRDDLESHRVDELARQQKHRDAAKRAGRHELASDAKHQELQRKLEQMVDRIAALSRAGFRREVMQILRKYGPLLPAKVDSVGARHELPSALDTAGNGSRSRVDGDGVTDRDGSG